jgi:two-component sensor histidine kinase
MQPDASQDFIAEVVAARPPPGACDQCHIVEEADHRIANHLALLAGIVRLKAIDVARQDGAPTRESVQILLENLRAQIDAVAGLHRSFAIGGRGVSADLSAHLHDICAPLAAVLGDRIELVEDFAPGRQVEADQILPLTQIVAEAVTNAIKHACPPGRRSRITITSRGDATGVWTVEVQDQGPGLPAGFDPLHDGALGSRLMRALAKQLDARIAFVSDGHGLRVRLTLPPRANRAPLR